MKGMIKYMLKALVSLDTSNINGLSDSLKGHNPAVYKISFHSRTANFRSGHLHCSST